MVDWDCIGDIHPKIFAMAGRLTLYLNGGVLNPDNKTSQALWGDVFRTNWQGNFDSLPHTTPWPLTFSCIRTRWMYDKCKKYFADINEHAVLYCATQRGTSNYIKINPLQHAAMQNLWLDELQDLLERPVLLANVAVVGGHFRLLTYLAAEYQVNIQHSIQRIEWSIYREYSIDIPAARGDLDMIQYLHDAQCECSSGAMNNAARNGHFEVVKWLHQHRTEGCTSNALNGAFLNDHLDIFKYLEDHQLGRLSEGAIVFAAARGDMDKIKILHEHYQFNCTRSALRHAAFNGHLEAVKYLHANEPQAYRLRKYDTSIYPSARDTIYRLFEERTRGIHTEFVAKCTDIQERLSRSRFADPSQPNMDAAASKGHLDTVQTFHNDNRAKCSRRTLQYAACNGHLDIVMFAHENCNEACTTDAIVLAAAQGHLNVVNYLMENCVNGCSNMDKSSALYDRHLAIVEYFLTNHADELNGES